MKIFDGKSVFDGVAIGKIHILKKEKRKILCTHIEDVEEEIAKLEAELKYQKEFLESVRKKLSNERFTAHAPEKVVAVERKKEADSLSKIESYEAQHKALKSL